MGHLSDLIRLGHGILRPKGELPAPFLEKRAIFIHIPKAAGSSVSQALFGCQVGHQSIRDLYATNYLAARRCFKFTFVREPLDRLHSAYEFLRQGGINENDREFAAAYVGDLDFAAFVDSLEREPAMQDWWHLRTQQSFLTDPKQPSKVLVDFVGRYENLEADFLAICDRMGVSVPLPRANPTKGRTGIAAVDRETVARVRHIYACDYELFGYA